MNSLLKISLVITLLIIFFANGIKSQENIDFYLSKTLRIENEIKINIPNDVYPELLNYVHTNYTSEKFFLKQFDPGFSTEFAEDLIIDQYFDNANMQLINGQDGIRHRKRIVLSNEADKKHGRELMQIKLDSVDGNELSRGELKYDIKYYDKKDAEYDNHPFLGLIKREDRYLAIREMKRLEIDPFSLFPTIKVEQNRKRVYVRLNDEPLITLTVDSVVAYYGLKKVDFIELELEINEILYTESDSTQRVALENYSSLLLNDLQINFPDIKQDQTPKYNKAFNQLELTGFKEPGSVFNKILIGIIVFVILIVLFSVFYKRKNNKKKVRLS